MEFYPGESQVILLWAPIAVITLGVIVCGALAFIAAPYGRYVSSSWGPVVPARVAWVVQETPSALAIVWFWLGSNDHKNTVNMVLMGIFTTHYIYRTYIYPFTMVKSKNGSPMFTFLFAVVWCVYNGYAIGRHFGEFGHLYAPPYLYTPRFIFGVALWAFGFLTNIHSDYTLSHLRQPGETGYKIPYGGAFEYVSGANFFGEIVEWTGFAIASQAPVAFAFAFFTFCNIGPRALEHHRWYQKTFGVNYPKNRKALIPFIL